MSARTVAVGRRAPGDPLRIRYAITDELWQPEPSRQEDDDLDLYKENLESQLAWGGDL